MAAVGTAVALYAVLKRHNGSLALGFVTSRMFEAAVITMGVLSLLAVVSMRQDGLLGAPLLLVAFLLAYFGSTDQVSPVSGLLTFPVAAWELGLGVWLAVKGFTPSPVLVA